MNHAALGPVSLPVKEAITNYLENCAYHGSQDFLKWMDRLEAIRASLARLIGAGSQEMAFVENTSQGLNAIANSLQWEPGDVVLISYPEFPANIYPWLNLQRLGVTIRYLERQKGSISINNALNSICPRTRLLVISSVDYATGFAADLEGLGQMCQSKGILFCLDAIQSLGLLPIDVKASHVHFMSSGGYKWLLGPMGTGCLFIDDSVRHFLQSSHVGWKSVINPEDFDIDFTLKKEAARFEPGNLNLAGIFGLGASVELLLEIGIPTIWQRVKRLIQKLQEGIEQRGLSVYPGLGASERSGILTFIPPKNPEDLARFLEDQGIAVSLRHGRIRLSPHFYNNNQDIEYILSVLDQYLS